MKRILASACLILACSAALADSTNPLLDEDRVQGMTEAEHLDAVRTENVNDRDEYLRTPLHLATVHGTSETVTALINAGANIESRMENGSTPLHVAAMYGTSETVIALTDTGA